MMSMLFRRIPGRSAASACALLALLLAGCNYSFRAGGGFPSDIRTMHIAAFDNETVQLDLGNQLFRMMSERLPRALGVRPAAETQAHAVVTGRVVRYEDVALTRPAAPGAIEVVHHQVQIAVAVQIVDVRRNEILWESSALVGRGEYRPESQTDEVARDLALEHIVRQIIDGAQSQW
jgi:hypothetical protein